jgi:hypothetical protein
MDNLSSHKGSRVRELIEGRGCELIYLPPYSPDLNPIEQAFSKVKEILRRVEACTREVLIEVMGQALSAVTVADTHGFFAHCSYRAMGRRYDRRSIAAPDSARLQEATEITYQV